MSNRNPRNLHLLSQISEKNPLRSTVAERAFDIGRAFDRDIEAIGLDRNLSAEGRRDQAKARAHKALLELQAAQKLIDAHHRETEGLRASVKSPTFDKADYVGALNRKELRDASRAMSLGEKTMRMIGPKRSKAFVDAVAFEFEDAAWLGGFDTDNPNEAELLEEAKQLRRLDLNPELLPALEARATVETEVAMAVNIVLNDIQSDAADLGAARAA